MNHVRFTPLRTYVFKVAGRVRGGCRGIGCQTHFNHLKKPEAIGHKLKQKLELPATKENTRTMANHHLSPRGLVVPVHFGVLVLRFFAAGSFSRIGRRPFSVHWSQALFVHLRQAFCLCICRRFFGVHRPQALFFCIGCRHFFVH